MSCELNCKEVAEQGKTKVEESLAMELLKGYSSQAHRWFIAFVIVLCMWFGTIGGFIWFLNQYNFESNTSTVITQDTGTNKITGVDVN